MLKLTKKAGFVRIETTFDGGKDQMTTKKRGCIDLKKGYIEETADEKTAEQIVSEMLTRAKFGPGGAITNVNWLPLAAMHALIYCQHSLKCDKDWHKNLQRITARLDKVYEKISTILFELEKKNVLVSSTSKGWRSKKLGFTRVSVHRIVLMGSESQFLLDNGEFYEFKSLADAEDFVRYFQECYAFLALETPELLDMELVITVNTVMKTMRVNAFPEAKGD